MNLPGLLIEYLINGSIAIIWLTLLVDVSAFTSIVENQALLLVPIVYVLGMFIDFIAWIVTKPFKEWIRSKALDEIAAHKMKEGEEFDKSSYEFFWNEKMEIEKNYPDLNKELTSRSSRDRIARGVMINLIPITILYWPYIHFFGIALFILSAFMWMKFEHYNRCFELRAACSVRKSVLPKN